MGRKLDLLVRVSVPLVVVCGLVWFLSGLTPALAVVGVVAVAAVLLVRLGVVGALPAERTWGEQVEALASLCSPRAILRSASGWQAAARTFLLVLMLPSLLLLLALRRLSLLKT